LKKRTAKSTPPATRLAIQIASRILEHLRVNGFQKGQHLPSQTLAATFRVSRAPVNAAFKLLEELGVVRAEVNRGYFLAIDTGQLARVELPQEEEDTEDDFYFELAADRLSGKLPARVTENELMRQYSMSRSRLVKTLTHIAQEGWIERLPGHGWEFRTTLASRESYEAGYRFRATIEAAAVLEPGYHVDAAAFQEIRRQQQSLLQGGLLRVSRVKLFAINTDFHETIVRCCGNEFYLDALRRVNRLRRLIEYRVTVDRSRLPGQCQEHIEILDLLEAGKFSTAATYLRRHIEGARSIKAGKV
jgi:DNA-binding GntR family transcriptional regulator